MTGYESKKAMARDKLAQPAQEPVGFVDSKLNPIQRPWVGLTDEEFQLIYDMGRTPTGMMEMVETMLKEKNT